MISEEIPSAMAGERIDRIVSMLTGCSRSEASSVVADGQCLVDGSAVTKPSVRLLEGQRVDVLVDPNVVEPPPAPDPSIDVDVVYSDESVAVVDKPAGLVVHPAAGVKDGTLVNGLLARFPQLVGVGDPRRPGIVHRLDRGTSGLMVVALDATAAENLVQKLSNHDVERVYDSVVWGTFDTVVGTVDAPIGRSRRNPARMTVATGGRRARTHYEVAASFDLPRPMTRLTLRLETGRTHQIRVHLASIGHPVVGDVLYAGPRPDVGVGRPFLHATRLSFDHPITGAHLSFDSPLPADLEQAVAGFS